MSTIRGVRMSDLPPDMRTAVARSPGTRANLTEARRGEALELLKRAGQVRDYRFQPLTFRLADDCRYTPDYMVIESDGTVSLEDVKGKKGAGFYAREDATIKIRVAAESYPWFRFRVVWETARDRWATKEYGP